MTPQQKLVLTQDAWVRQMVSYDISEQRARDCVAMAELNGLFDLHKAEFAKQEREYTASTIDDAPCCGSENNYGGAR